MEDRVLAFIELCVLLLPALAVLVGYLLRTEALKLRALLFSQLCSLAFATCAFIAVCLKPFDWLVSSLANIFDLRFDFFSSCLLLVIAFIASVVLFYSERYLVGDKNRLSFIQNLLALSFVSSLLVLSDSLVISLLCWNGISMILWRLLAMRQEAAGAAKLVLQHHLASDVLLGLAVAILFNCCHTVTISQLPGSIAALSKSVELWGYTMPFHCGAVIALLLVLSMSIKSALFPFHRWLLATLEAPTPLSGLLHAGVVNVSAILAARLWPVLQESSFVLIVWGMLASVSAVAGTLIMSAQSDVKRKLVFSTVGQMGFMCLQCASGAIPAAVFHLVAHGLFKCHMFLQSGSAVSEGLLKKRWNFSEQDNSDPGLAPSTARLRLTLTVLLLFVALPLGLWLWQEHSVSSETALSVLIAAAAICTSLPALKRVNFVLLFASGLMGLLIVFSSDLLAHMFDARIAPELNEQNWLLPVAIFAFALVALVRYLVSASDLGKALYVHALNGFYVDHIAQRFFAGLKVSSSGSASKETI
jgi:NADH:ubiquinone oxidoreductase subunit 5 (subunit L)/multisubunit Na+/H+ antiporter MnhA subunit